MAETPSRVVHVVRSLEVGGLERLVSELVLERGTSQTSVVCLTRLGSLGERLLAEGGEVHVLENRDGGARALLEMRQFLRRWQPDVVHCHNMFAHLYGGLAARLAGRIPVVLTKHGMILPAGGLGAHVNRWLVKQTAVVGVSEPICELMRQWLPRHADVRHIPNGVRLDGLLRASPASDRPPSASPERQGYVFGMVCRLAPQKDFETLLAAFADIVREEPSARLVIVGDGPVRREISATVDRLGLSPHVALLGERQDVAALLPTFDAFVLSSHQEGIPMTILEAMAAGLPVIATAVGGVPSMVVDGETGRLVPPRSPTTLKAAMSEAIRAPEQARQRGLAGRTRVEQEFDLRRVVARYEEVYVGLCGSSSPVTPSR
jgi:glycosyltransferase involved in cell wall biosynthesis